MHRTKVRNALTVTAKIKQIYELKWISCCGIYIPIITVSGHVFAIFVLFWKIYFRCDDERSMVRKILILFSVRKLY